MSLLATAVLVSQSAFGQIPGGEKGSGGLNAAMIRIFGAHTNFISKVDVRVLNKNQQETSTLPMGLEMLSGKIRVEINLNQIKSKELSAEAVTQMKQLGMDQLITVQVNDKKLNLFIYPNLKSYAETPMTKDEMDTMTKAYKLDKTRLGKETIDGHPCEKDSVTLSDDKGNQEKAVVWYATDLKDFPLQIQITQDTDTMIMHFRDIKLGRPDAALFEAPAGMAKFDSMEALMSDAAAKKMNAATGKTH
jgi:hypothetical protein